jgi:hypothetical protein
LRCLDLFGTLLVSHDFISCLITRMAKVALAVGYGDPADYRKIWLTYVDYLRRRMSDKEDDKEKFEKG